MSSSLTSCLVTEITTIVHQIYNSSTFTKAEEKKPENTLLPVVIGEGTTHGEILRMTCIWLETELVKHKLNIFFLIFFPKKTTVQIRCTFCTKVKDSYESWL
jgi:hypothetical protein